MTAEKKSRDNSSNSLGKGTKPANDQAKPGKPYEMTYSETFVEPIGLPPKKGK